MITLFALLALLDVHVHGVVRDTATREPLHAATIRVIGTTRGTVTDRNGVFHVHDVAGDSVLLQFSHVGYTTKRMMLAVGGRDDVRNTLPSFLPRRLMSIADKPLPMFLRVCRVLRWSRPDQVLANR